MDYVKNLLLELVYINNAICEIKAFSIEFKKFE